MPKVVTQALNPYEITQMRKTMSNHQIAAYYGLKYDTYMNWCRTNKIETRRIADWELLEEIETKTVKEIAFEYNVKIGYLYNRLRIIKGGIKC